MEKIDALIVGGGIVGLWSAYEVLKSHPEWTVVVCEKEPFCGDHSTGRNSEVLHAGIYYETGSLKHRTCVQGNQLWREFSQKHSVPINLCGKFIVARQAQQDKIEKLFQQAVTNEVSGVRWMTEQEIRHLRPWVHLENGFFSPNSAVLNVSESLKILKLLIEDAGGIILLKTAVEIRSSAQDGFCCQIGDDLIHVRNLINAAGHGACALRQQLGLDDYINFYVKGSYLILQDSMPLSQLIYPIPPEHGLGLGVHLTLDSAGTQKFGPNTEMIHELNYQISEACLESMYPSIVEVFPEIKKQQLRLGYTGIRPKIKNKNGNLVKDFLLQTAKEHGVNGYFEFLGIESPGLTAAPALAVLLTEKIG